MSETMKPKISIVDYGLCNLYNVSNALEHIGANITIIDKPHDIEKASHIILPGVGAFKNGMRGLNLRELVQPLKEHIVKNRPFLGICLGMQMMLSKSYEFGEIEGLDIIDGDVEKIPKINSSNITHKIPHIGWNKVIINENVRNHHLLTGQDDKSSMYFVHSYRVNCNNKDNIMATTNYNDVNITAIINKNNAYGCQFHPEKSGKYGLNILKQFVKS
ncbi:MAG: imidazole glycerol phosphate synthase subunit HisH [Gammaproteobacteria bacterium]|nr:imidazole glycerol phosphate synthase subunit HisH [Gammaproteobacteria bacterium]